MVEVRNLADNITKSCDAQAQSHDAFADYRMGAHEDRGSAGQGTAGDKRANGAASVEQAHPKCGVHDFGTLDFNDNIYTSVAKKLGPADMEKSKDDENSGEEKAESGKSKKLNPAEESKKAAVGKKVESNDLETLINRR